MTKNHVVFFSGGLGSWRTFREVSEEHGIENTYCLFTDTLIEDRDLYRFMIEVWSKGYRIQATDLLGLVEELPSNFTEGKEDERKRKLTELGTLVETRFPNVIWRNAGRSPFDIYIETKYLGNSRLSKCSHIIKQDLAKELVEKYFSPEDSILYLGIDFTEAHRSKKPKENWLPYQVEFPLIENYEKVMKEGSHEDILAIEGIKIPRLYKKGFTHNNCGGFCSRAGQKHFINLLEINRPAFLYVEKKEREWQQIIGKDNTILRRQRNNKKQDLPLSQLRLEYEEGRTEKIDMLDFGGCGCFSVYEDEAERGGAND